jgi:predicted GIY-YIG superfamily endonuclease
MSEVAKNQEHSTEESKQRKPHLIYVLLCENEKYYVGKTANLIACFQSHRNAESESCMWTRMYPPVQAVYCAVQVHNTDEDVQVKRIMMKYGIQNVRGGSYGDVVLEDFQLLALEKEFKTARGQCYTCSMSGHHSRECTQSLSNKEEKKPVENNMPFSHRMR